MTSTNKTANTIARKGKLKKVIAWLILTMLLATSGYVYYQYYFVFGEGVKSGYLNYAVKKGNIFKTYEGKLIQEGFGSTKIGTGLSSNQFEFSVVTAFIPDLSDGDIIICTVSGIILSLLEI